MSPTSSVSTLNIYEEDINVETTMDLSAQHLKCVPPIENYYLCILYLQNNDIESLPENIFDCLQNLMYLDVRDNKLTEIPKSIKHHPCLTHLLLQNNQLTLLPNELGTVSNLKMLQLAGNPLTYPPKEIIEAGGLSVKNYLHDKYMIEVAACRSDVSEDTLSTNDNYSDGFLSVGRSYNSVIDCVKNKETMLVQINEKLSDGEPDEEYYPTYKGKCPKLAKSRVIFSPHSQSSKYLKPLKADGKLQEDKIKQSLLKDMAIKKHKDFIESRDKILQGRKNVEMLRNWRKTYMLDKFSVDGSYKMDPKTYPYDTHPEYLTLLSREDIEKDLPDKYRKKLIKRCKPTVPRKSNNDVHLALKIKQLFENLEAIDLNRKDMTPRTEQKVLMSEIQKISEIKQKLTELSTTNNRSVSD